MKNFDEARKKRAQADRSFTIGGETFERKPGVRPEVLLEWSDLTAGTPSGRVLEVIDEVVLAMISPNGKSAARWEAVRESEDDPVTLADLHELVSWLVEEELGETPIRQDLLSSPGLEAASESSTDASSSPVAVKASATSTRARSRTSPTSR